MAAVEDDAAAAAAGSDRDDMMFGWRLNEYVYPTGAGCLWNVQKRNEWR